MQRIVFTPNDHRDTAAAMLEEPEIRSEINQGVENIGSLDGNQFHASRLLEHVAAHPQVQEPPDVLGLAVLAQDEDLRARDEPPDLERRLQPAESGHGDIHDDEVGLERHGEIDRLLPVGGLAHHIQVAGRSEEGAHAVADDRVVVGDEDSGFH